jgi:hypothetical protein
MTEDGIREIVRSEIESILFDNVGINVTHNTGQLLISCNTLEVELTYKGQPLVWGSCDLHLDY